MILMLNKPRGVVVTRSDERGRRTVYDLLPAWARAEGWVPVGRLDADSSGLLLFTRDGRVVDRLTRPGACDKTYVVWVRGRVTDDHLAAARRGVSTPEGVLRAKRAESLGGAGPKSRVRVVLDEGRNRHIRRLFGALRDPRFGTPLKVLKLTRVAVGPLELPADLASGRWRFLTPAECARFPA